jgi:hypothetical protein
MQREVSCFLFNIFSVRTHLTKPECLVKFGRATAPTSAAAAIPGARTAYVGDVSHAERG